jgi:radical SAM superfamily enzyme YgiQ (UPF0313 family)
MASRKRTAHPGADPGVANRRRLESESGAIVKPHAGRLRVALAYPNSYATGMSNLGVHALYAALNARDDVVCERLFLPDADEIGWLDASRRPLASFESNTPVAAFDLVAFSVTFEGDYHNVVRLLTLAGIRPRDRSDDDPLVIAGGIAVTMNPEPLAPFMDALYIGEADITDETIDLLRSRDRRRLARLPGFYVPAGYTPRYAAGRLVGYDVADGYPERIRRVWRSDAMRRPNVTVIDAPEAVFGDMGLVETGKGCGKHCRFCAAGYIYRPTRHADADALLAAIDDAVARKGKVGLMGSALGDHPDLETLMERVVERGGSFSVSSLRLDRIGDRTLAALSAGNCHTITVAPEAGSQRVRRAINKDLTDETILDAVTRIGAAGPFHIKCYFLVGFPGETDDEALAIVDLTARIQERFVDASRSRGTVGRLTVGVDVFVPKPFTPFQWAPFVGAKIAQKRLAAVGKGLRKIANVTPMIGSAKAARFQAILSVGDRRIAPIIERAAADGDWKEAVAAGDIDVERLVERERSVDDLLPWGLLDHGLRPGYLEKEWRLFAKEKLTPECPLPGEPCRRCGSFIGVCVDHE